MPIARERRAAATLAGIAVAAALTAGCGGDAEDGQQAQAQALGELRAGSVARLARCEDWNAGTVDEKNATVDDIRAQLSPSEEAAEDPPLTDEEAYELFEEACSDSFATSFKLYILYYRAQAFQSLTDENLLGEGAEHALEKKEGAGAE